MKFDILKKGFIGAKDFLNESCLLDRVKLINYDCLHILVLLYIMLYIMLAYLMLFASLCNAVCLYNASFFCY